MLNCQRVHLVSIAMLNYHRVLLSNQLLYWVRCLQTIFLPPVFPKTWNFAMFHTSNHCSILSTASWGSMNVYDQFVSLGFRSLTTHVWWSDNWWAISQKVRKRKFMAPLTVHIDNIYLYTQCLFYTYDCAYIYINIYICKHKGIAVDASLWSCRGPRGAASITLVSWTVCKRFVAMRVPEARWHWWPWASNIGI